MAKTIDLFLSHNNADKPWTERLAGRTEWGRAQVGRLRQCLIKIGARVMERQRRVTVELCISYPWQRVWRGLSQAMGIDAG